MDVDEVVGSMKFACALTGNFATAAREAVGALQTKKPWGSTGRAGQDRERQGKGRAEQGMAEQGTTSVLRKGKRHPALYLQYPSVPQLLRSPSPAIIVESKLPEVRSRASERANERAKRTSKRVSNCAAVLIPIPNCRKGFQRQLCQPLKPCTSSFMT